MAATRVQESSNIAPQQQAKPAPAQPSTWEKVCFVVKHVFLHTIDCLKACFYGREIVFYSACENGHTYTVLKWMKLVDLENHGKDFFYTAARASQTGILSLLKNNGVDAKAPLIDALFKHNFKACNNLLPFLSLEELQAIEVTLREKYQTTIMKEIALDYHSSAKDLVQTLLEKGLSLDSTFISLFQRTTECPWTSTTEKYALSEFLESFSDINAIRVKLPGSDVSMPLLSAAICLENDEAAFFLLGNRDLKIDERDVSGRTPLMHACDKRRTDLINQFIFRKANLGAQDNNGKTALMFLGGPFHPHHSLQENEGRLALLIEMFASTIGIRDLDGKTAFSYLMKENPNVFLRCLDLFDEKTCENFVLEALAFDDPEDLYFAIYKLISKGCGVIDGELSYIVRAEITVQKLKKNDPEFSKNIDQAVEDGLKTFQKTQKKEVKSNE